MVVETDNAIQRHEEFENDTAVLGEQAGLFVQTASPYLAVNQGSIRDYLDIDSAQIVDGMRFFKLISCSTERVDDLAAFLNEKMD